MNMVSKEDTNATARLSGKKRRNRIPVSCFSCRMLKTKCDGHKPICSTCAHNGRDCAYVQQGISGNSGSTVRVSQEYLKTLEERLEALERGPTEASAPESMNHNISTNQHDLNALQTQTVAMTDRSPDVMAQGDTPASVVADANVSMGGVSFTQLILNAMHGHEGVRAQSMTTDKDVRDKQSYLNKEDLYALPHNASDLIEKFLSFRHGLSPVFHIPTVRPKFEAAITCPRKERHYHQSTFILLNMMFAICTSHWLEGTVSNAQVARKYYDTAMVLMQTNLLRDWNLEHVQALLLGVRYLQGSNSADECWNILGLAIRIAYGLRLHQDPPETDPYPLRETKRRVWFAAYTLDILFSMIYERPAAIRSNECSVLLPEDLDDHCIQTDGLLYPMPKRPSSTRFSIEVVKLYQILESYMLNSRAKIDNNRGIAECIMTHDEDYRTWYASLPRHLILDYHNVEEQPLILALRANMVRIMIHRQSLAITLRDLIKPQKPEDTMISNLLQYSRNITVAAAMESIDIVALRHEQCRYSLVHGWFDLYYLFNAILILVSHVVDPAYSNDKVVLAKVDIALHMIKTLSNNHAFAQRAYVFLQQLLSYKDKSIRVRTETENSLLPLTTQPIDTIVTGINNDAEPIPDLYALFGFTQDLADDLGSHLEDFDDRGISGWTRTFNDQLFS